MRRDTIQMIIFFIFVRNLVVCIIFVFYQKCGIPSCHDIIIGLKMINYKYILFEQILSWAKTPYLYIFVYQRFPAPILLDCLHNIPQIINGNAM